jgi:3-hydroxyacyl-CoA dehydrogenase
VAEAFYAAALDEARRCIDEDVAAPGDVDLAMRHGCGWGAGPLEWSRSDEGRTA